MKILELLNQVITERGSAAVLKERQELLRDQIALLEQENTKLKSENAAMKARLKLVDVSPEFEEYRGTLWKREAADKVEPYPYCKKCKTVMHDFAHVQWVCGDCNSSTPLVRHPEAAKR